MSRLDELVVRHPLATWRSVAWPVMSLLAVLLIWAQFAHLDEVAVATGEVVPQGKIKVVQHLEGGIIEHIHVVEGSVVRAGDPLVRLDLATSGVNRKELLARLDGAILRRARLLAESSGAVLALPTDATSRQPNVAEAERQAHAARRRELDSTLGVLKQQAQQRELEVQELEAKKRSASNNLGLARERLRMSASLLQEGLTARMEHLRLQAEVENLEGELQALGPALPRARAAVAEALQRLKEGELRFQRQARDELGETEQTIARVRELLAQATDQGVRAEIRSPIDGIVKKLRYNTIGGVVAPGEAIMDIVPTGDKLVIQAKLSPIDRGYVDSGQPALVKISTYDFVRYGGLSGVVSQVAPDASTDKAGAPYFEVVVETDKAYLGDSAGALPITPGMQATVDIHTGTRSVMDYLIKPVLKLRDEAFRER
jgi:membrane fusion protein, adhesin transport system